MAECWFCRGLAHNEQFFGRSPLADKTFPKRLQQGLRDFQETDSGRRPQPRRPDVFEKFLSEAVICTLCAGHEDKGINLSRRRAVSSPLQRRTGKTRATASRGVLTFKCMPRSSVRARRGRLLRHRVAEPHGLVHRATLSIRQLRVSHKVAGCLSLCLATCTYIHLCICLCSSIQTTDSCKHMYLH